MEDNQPERLSLEEERQKYSTFVQRERMLIDLLDLKFEGYKLHWCDQVRQDQTTVNGNLKVRQLSWRLGQTEFLVSYHEVKDVPGSALFRLRSQPTSPDGRILNKWKDIMTFGEFEGELRSAKKQKGYSSGDLKAQAKADIHKTAAKPHGIILEGLTGSHAYGLAHDGYVDPDSGETVPPSDVDTRGVYVVNTLREMGFDMRFVQIKGEDTAYDELQRFMFLCSSKCNPERLEMLAAKKTIETPEGKLIVDNRDMFLSKRVISVYGGYAQGQLGRIERNVDRKTKPAMHLIRLMITGIRALKEGVIDPDMSEYRDRMLAIRTGAMPISDVFKWHQELEIEFAKAASETKLPDEPDWNRINKVLQEIRLNHLVSNKAEWPAGYREEIKQRIGFEGFGVHQTK